jgi:Organic solute transporter Ostalpha
MKVNLALLLGFLLLNVALSAITSVPDPNDLADEEDNVESEEEQSSRRNITIIYDDDTIILHPTEKQIDQEKFVQHVSTILRWVGAGTSLLTILIAIYLSAGYIGNSDKSLYRFLNFLIIIVLIVPSAMSVSATLSIWMQDDVPAVTQFIRAFLECILMCLFIELISEQVNFDGNKEDHAVLDRIFILHVHTYGRSFRDSDDDPNNTLANQAPVSQLTDREINRAKVLKRKTFNKVYIFAILRCLFVIMALFMQKGLHPDYHLSRLRRLISGLFAIAALIFGIVSISHIFFLVHVISEVADQTRIRLKFYLLEGTLFITFWQSLLFDLFQEFRHYFLLDIVLQHQQDLFFDIIEDGLICAEMLLISVFFLWAFPIKRFKQLEIKFVTNLRLDLMRMIPESVLTPAHTVMQPLIRMTESTPSTATTPLQLSKQLEPAPITVTDSKVVLPVTPKQKGASFKKSHKRAQKVIMQDEVGIEMQTHSGGLKKPRKHSSSSSSSSSSDDEEVKRSPATTSISKVPTSTTSKKLINKVFL